MEHLLLDCHARLIRRPARYAAPWRGEGWRAVLSVIRAVGVGVLVVVLLGGLSWPLLVGRAHWGNWLMALMVAAAIAGIVEEFAFPPGSPDVSPAAFRPAPVLLRALSFVFCLLSLCGIALLLAPVARGAAESAPDDGLRPGEIQVSGVVRSVDLAAGQVVVNVDRVITAGQEPVRLLPPRAKVVLVDDATRLYRDGRPEETIRLADLVEGSPVSAYGRNQGTGQPLIARVIQAQVPAAGIALPPVPGSNAAPARAAVGTIPPAAAAAPASAVAAASAPAGGAPPAMFPFVLPWDDASHTFTDLSTLNDGPAGSHGFIRVKDGHFCETDTGRRVRFVGVSLSFEACFPERGDASKIAARLRKFGVNAVRLYAIDNEFNPNGTLLLLSAHDHRHLDPNRLDRLDYLVNELEKQGIYVVFTLHVNRTLTPEDGLPASSKDLMFPANQRIDYFDRQVIDLQKEYDRALLTHANPYTGKAYTDDPGVLSVEMTHEDSLLGGVWADRPGAGLTNLPEPYEAELRALWNGWLMKRYGGAAALKAAWSQPSTEPDQVPAGAPKPAQAEVDLRTLEGSLEDGTVPLPDAFYGVRRVDWLWFLAEVERSYADEMKSFLQNDLHLHALVVCTQINHGWPGAPFRESDMDYTTVDAAWQGPVFPHKPWDPADWTIANGSMVQSREAAAMLSHLACLRVEGKPFVLGEWNQPAPSIYQAECVPVLFSFAALQDWDAVFLHDYGTYGEGGDNSRIQGFFAVGSNPAKFALLPSAVAMFRLGQAPPAPGALDTWMPGDPQRTFTTRTAALVSNEVEMSQGGDLVRRVFLQLSPVPRGWMTGPAARTLSWNAADPGSAVYTVNAPGACAAVGMVGGRTIVLGEQQFRFDPIPNQFAALTLTALDGKDITSSERVLLTVVDRVENTGMQWNPEHTSVGLQWGTAPSLADGVPVHVTIKTDGPRKVFALAPTGELEQPPLESRYQDGELEFSVGPENHTLWYAIGKG